MLMIVVMMMMIIRPPHTRNLECGTLFYGVFSVIGLRWWAERRYEV